MALKEIGGRIRVMLKKYMLEFGMLEDVYIASGYISRQYIKEEVEHLRRVVEEVINNLG